MTSVPLSYKGIHISSNLPRGVFNDGDYWIHSGKDTYISGVGNIAKGDWLIYHFDHWDITSVNKNDTEDAATNLDWNIQ